MPPATSELEAVVVEEEALRRRRRRRRRRRFIREEELNHSRKMESLPKASTVYFYCADHKLFAAVAVKKRLIWVFTRPAH